MKYSSIETQSLLQALNGAVIQEIYYYETYDDYDIVIIDDPNIRSAVAMGVQIDFSTGRSLYVASGDYFPYVGVEGIVVKVDAGLDNPRPLHFKENFYAPFYQKSVLNIEVYETDYHAGDQKFVVPSGIRIIFSDNEGLYLFNVGVESIKPDGSLELVRGTDEITIIRSDDVVKKYELLTRDTIDIESA